MHACKAIWMPVSHLTETKVPAELARRGSLIQRPRLKPLLRTLLQNYG